MSLEYRVHRRKSALLVDRVGRDVRDDGDARNAFEAVAHGGEPRREKLDLILRQQDDVRFAAEGESRCTPPPRRSTPSPSRIAAR